MSKIMNKYSITNALNLDGGGSTTLVIDGERVNRLPGNQPNERVVPNHIGFKVE
jgi:exopolysaccharide biosynthesis protein